MGNVVVVVVVSSGIKEFSGCGVIVLEWNIALRWKGV